MSDHKFPSGQETSRKWKLHDNLEKDLKIDSKVCVQNHGRSIFILEIESHAR